MDGGKSHRGVEGLVLEGKALCDGSHARRCACRTLGAHERRRFHRGYVTVGRLVGAGASPDIQYGPRIAERSPDSCGDPRLGASCHGRSGPDGVVQLRLDMSLSPWPSPSPRCSTLLGVAAWMRGHFCVPFHHIDPPDIPEVAESPVTPPSGTAIASVRTMSGTARDSGIGASAAGLATAAEASQAWPAV